MSALPNALVKPTFGEASLDLDGHQIVTRWMFVSPEIAEDFLKANVNNRNLRAKHVEKLAKDLRNGEMVVHHQGIAFDEEGNLSDGQHRCHGIVKSGVGMWMLVTTGLPVKAKKRVDLGAGRQSFDFQEGGFKSNRAAAARTICAIRALDGDLTIKRLERELAKVTNAEIQNVMDEPGAGDIMLKYAGLASSAARMTDSVTPSGLLASAVVYPDIAEEWLSGIASASGMETGDPRLTLIRYRTAKKIERAESSFLALKAATNFSRKRKMNTVRWSRDERLVVPLI